MSLPYEIGVRAEVVVEDVLDNLKLEDLVDYIAKRKGGSQVLQALPDMTELRDAVARDDGRRCVDIL
ncbi:MAG TPA: hypothetical protein VEA79_14195, partial [Phenylobacterium sp.]|nr:hypothetical protein [Phenylobacterium sp.]